MNDATERASVAAGGRSGTESRIPGPRHASVQLTVERCAGCCECVRRCPTGALAIDSRRDVVRAEDARCVGCRQRERVCPFHAITVTGPLVLAARSAERVVYPEPIEGDISEVRRGCADWSEARHEADRCLQCPDPTCVAGCPAHNDIPGFIAAVRERDLAAARAVLSRSSVLPDVCSRVCDARLRR